MNFTLTYEIIKQISKIMDSAFVAMIIGFCTIGVGMIGTIIMIYSGNQSTNKRIDDIKSELQEMRSQSQKSEIGIRSDMKAMEAGIRTDMKTMETALRSDMNSMGESLREEMKEIKIDIRHLRDRVDYISDSMNISGASLKRKKKSAA